MSIVEPTSTQLNSLLDPFFVNQPNGLGIVIGYVGPDFHNIYLSGSLLNQNGHDLPLTTDTPFEIASVSKTFTATLYALLIDKVAIPDPVVGDFDLGIGEQFNAIPLISLINYTSGLPADNVSASDVPPYLAQPYSMPGMLGFLSMNALQPRPPNKIYRYSNLAFGIMAAILAKIADQDSTFEELIRAEIFDRLSMSSRFFDQVRIDHLPRGFNYDQGAHSPGAPGWNFFPAYNGAGGVVATPNDMMSWLQFNMGVYHDPVLTPLLQRLQAPSTSVKIWGDSLGLSWFLTPSTDGSFAYTWKDGDLSGFASYMAFLPSDDIASTPSSAGVFMQTNSNGQTASGLPLNAYVCYNLLRIMQGLEPTADARYVSHSRMSRYIEA